MAIAIKRITDPVEGSDGRRILITRYRPRAIAKGDEPWHEWDKRIAPSVELLDAMFGKRREGGRVVVRDLEPIAWREFAQRYRKQMKSEEARAALDELRARSAAGEQLTLLCYCEDEDRCHRSLARDLLTDE